MTRMAVMMYDIYYAQTINGTHGFMGRATVGLGERCKLQLKETRSFLFSLVLSSLHVFSAQVRINTTYRDLAVDSLALRNTCYTKTSLTSLSLS